MGIKDALIRLGDHVGEHSVTLHGNNELCVENCCCITAYDEDTAILRTATHDIRVIGTELVLENYGAYGVRITGQIYSIALEDIGKDDR